MENIPSDDDSAQQQFENHQQGEYEMTDQNKKLKSKMKEQTCREDVATCFSILTAKYGKKETKIATLIGLSLALIDGVGDKRKIVEAFTDEQIDEDVRETQSVLLEVVSALMDAKEFSRLLLILKSISHDLYLLAEKRVVEKRVKVMSLDGKEAETKAGEAIKKMMGRN